MQRKPFLATFCDKVLRQIACCSSVKLNSLSRLCAIQQTYLKNGYDSLYKFQSILRSILPDLWPLYKAYSCCNYTDVN